MFKVLIVEDNAMFRGLLKETLEKRLPWVRISEAASASLALRKLGAGCPDLVFVDIEMPERSGIELAKFVRAAHPSAGIVFLTGHDLPEYREAAAGLGAVHFLSKTTTTMEKIVRLVESLLPEHGVDAASENPT
jgi:DNA-binding NarL/FixJ family response regulator